LLSQYVIRRFTTAVMKKVYGDGEQSRDFTYVGNVVEANALAMDAEGVGGRVFNIAAGRCTSLNVSSRASSTFPGATSTRATTSLGRLTWALTCGHLRRRARARVPAADLASRRACGSR
jgi:hypothetical protein